MTRSALSVALLLAAAPVRAQAPCPAARDLPQLTIDKVHDPAVPVLDDWHVLWGNVPISDAQLAQLAGEDPLIDLTRKEMASRGTWVYIGMATAGSGAALSCAGWVLFGQNKLSQRITLPMAVGGLAIGIVGFLAVAEAIQSPLEPHLAPTPSHRISRDETRRLVALVNRRLYQEICKAADAAQKADDGPSTGAPAPSPAPAVAADTGAKEPESAQPASQSLDPP